MLDGMFTAVVAQLHVRFTVTQDKLPSSQEFLTFIELCNMIFKLICDFFWIRFTPKFDEKNFNYKTMIL